MTELTYGTSDENVQPPLGHLTEFARDSTAASSRTEARALAPGATDQWYHQDDTWYLLSQDSTPSPVSIHLDMSAPVDPMMTSCLAGYDTQS